MKLSELKFKFSTNNYSDILSLSTEEKESFLLELLGEISKDKNSSFFREGVTLGVIGVSQSEKKLGYDSDDEPIEVKPKNISSESKLKFDGGGNFSDFTWKRHKKYFDDNVKMVVSGFIDGKLLFVLSFMYTEKNFTDKIEYLLKKSLPNGDEKSRYVRSAKFSYKNYKDSKSLIIDYLSPNIVQYKHRFIEPFFNLLTNGNKK